MLKMPPTTSPKSLGNLRAGPGCSRPVDFSSRPLNPDRSMRRTEVLKIPEMGDEGESDAEGDAAVQMERERASGEAKVAKGLLTGGDVVECEIDMDAGVMSVWVNGVGHPER